MKKNVMCLLATMLLSSAFTMLNATTFESDGLYYSVRDNASNEVEITFQKASDENYSLLTNLIIPTTVENNGTKYTVTAIGKAAFAYSKGLKSAVVPSNIKEIGANAFYGCSNLRKIEFSNGLELIGRMAFAYSGLNSLVLPNRLVSLGDLSFAYCETLESVSIPNSVRSFGNNVFKDCIALESIKFADGLPIIGNYAFAGCTKLTKVVLPSGLKSPNKGAFAKCENLKEIVLGRDMENMGVGVFEDCNSLSEVRIPASNKYLKSTSDGVLLSSDGKSLFYYPVGKDNPSYTIPQGIEMIGASAFAGHPILQEVVIPSYIKEIGEKAFDGCPNLKTVNLNDGLKVIRTEAFARCPKLVGITIPRTVGKIEADAFVGTGDYLNKRNWKARLLYLGDCLIGQNPAQKKSGAMVVRAGTRLIADRALAESNITELEIPKEVEIIGDYAFFKSERLVDIKLPATLAAVGKQAFDSTAYFNEDKHWKNGLFVVGKVLMRVDPETNGVVKIKGIYLIADEAAAGCSEINDVKLDDKLRVIGKRAFADCVSLQSVNVPKQLMYIGKDAFKGAENISQSSFENVAKSNNPTADSDSYEIY